MPDYHVTWEVDVNADTPREAAEIARSYQTRPDTSAVVFDVFDGGGKSTRVDLLEDDDAPDAGEESEAQPSFTSEQRGSIADLLGDLETRVKESLHDIPSGGIHDEEIESLTHTMADIHVAQKLMCSAAEREG